MVKSMYAAVAGLRAHQSRMDVISNNISNVNTWGYKAKSASFKESMYQQMTAGSAGSVTDGSYGATNPAMYGYGSLVSAISSNFTQGSPSPTDRNMDLYIDGPSFFMVGPIYGEGNEKKPEDCYLSRVGDFEVRNGYLVDSNGRYVYGCTMEVGSETRKNEVDVLEGVLRGQNDGKKWLRNETLGMKELPADKIPATPPKVGEKVVTGTDPNTNTDIERYIIKIDDSDPNDIKYYYVDDPKVTMNIINADGEDGDSNTPEDTVIEIVFSPTKKGTLIQSTTSLNMGLGSVDIGYVQAPEIGDKFMDASGLEGKVSGVCIDVLTGEAKIEYDRVIDTNISYEGKPINNMDFDQKSGGYLLKSGVEGLSPIKIPTSCTYFDTEANNGIGEWRTENNVILNSFSVDKNGLITGTSKETGKTYVLGSLALVSVLNPNGMTQSDGPYYKLTDSAGIASVVQPGGDNGALSSGYLEMANVDIATEFSTMITTQRGFQANSKIITVTDEMLQELVNMKR